MNQCINYLFIMENCYFKKFEVIGTTKDEAKEKAGLNLMVDATQAFKKWNQNNAANEDDIREWLKDYLKKKKFDKPGIGAFIVTQTGVSDTRERPYKIKTIKYDSKTHTAEHFYVLRDMTGNVVGREKTKKAAEQAVREYITDYKENVNVYHEWEPKEKNSLVLEGTYTPSKGSKPWKLLVFGYVTVD